MTRARRAAALALAALAGCGPRGAEPARLGRAPHFDLVDARGANRCSDELAGRPWIANFVYTRCPGPCPVLTERMRGMPARLPADVRITRVSFSVDPENDTPAVLSAYARARGAEAPDWWLLTGPREAVRRLVVEGFRLPLDHARAGSPHGPILHTSRFVLVDGRGEVRGFYDGEDEEALARLGRDAARLEAR